MTDSSSRISPRLRLILLGVLVVLGIVYLALMPRLRQMNAETERLNRQAQEAQREAQRAGNLNSELEQAKATVALHPDDAEAHRKLAQSYATTGQLPEATRAMRQAAKLAPNDVALLFALADLSQRARHFDTTIAAYKAILALQPDEPRALTGLGYLYVLLGWPREAEALLRPAVTRMPDAYPLKVALAMTSVQQENFDVAERLLLEVKRAVPEQVAVWGPLVRMYSEARRYREAAAAATEVLQKLPDNIEMLTSLGEAQYRLGEYAQAEATFQKVLKAQPENISAHYYRALNCQQTNRRDEAIRELEFVLKNSPDYKLTRSLLGKLYVQAKRTAEGQKLLEEARTAAAQGQKLARISYRVAGHPEDAEAHRQLGTAYREQGDLGRAVAEFRRCLELKPGNPEVQALLLSTLRQANRNEEADALVAGGRE